MKKIQINQHNETDTLKTCIIGRYENYCSVEAYIERVNEKQEHLPLPDRETLKIEFDIFRKTLTDNGVEVIIPTQVGKFCYDQLTPRDIGVVIGNKFLICNMRRWSRRYEVSGVFRTLQSIHSPKEPNIIIPDSPTCYIEGGDIMVDKDMIFVAVSQRTNLEGVSFLEKKFGDTFKVIPIKTKQIEQGEDVLHLDCTFNPIGEKHALIYEEGFLSIPYELLSSYELIKVNKKQQQELATNVLSLSRNKIISRDSEDCKLVNAEIKKIGIEVIELPFNAAPRTGGSFRCCSLPLTRINSNI